MTPPAPHLPPRTCSVSAREIWSRLRWLALVIVLAVFAGATASLFMIDYWYPVDALVGSTAIINRADRGSPSLDAAAVRDWRYRLVRVYDESRVVGANYYPAGALVGHAVVLSSSGWSVVWAPSLSPETKSLAGVDVYGIRHPVEKMLAAPESGLWYLKFSGDEFRATTIFGSSEALTPGQALWALNGEWQAVTVGARLPRSGVQRATEPPYYYELSGYELAGRVIISERGEMIGVAGDRGILLPAWLIERQVPFLLESGVLDTRRPAWQGYFIEGVREGAVWKELSGFYDTGPSSAGAVSNLKAGDVIVRVNNEPAEKDRLARLLLSAPDEFTLTVIRGGDEVKVAVRKTK